MDIRLVDIEDYFQIYEDSEWSTELAKSKLLSQKIRLANWDGVRNDN